MHSVVRHGYCPRSSEAEEQTQEVLRRFDLADSGELAPFRRCLHCNGLLEQVEKQQVLERLADEPLTLRYYEDFWRCQECGGIYWPGSHFMKLANRVKRFAADTIPRSLAS
jgi:uncharacterized protein with PIN domain